VFGIGGLETLNVGTLEEWNIGNLECWNCAALEVGGATQVFWVSAGGAVQKF
jgi:hypothetical protein